MTPGTIHTEGYITFPELVDSWKEGNENILSFAGGAVIALLTSGMDKLAQSRFGKWFGLGSLAFLAAACGTSPVNSFVPPEITPAAPPTPTLVSPGENINFHAEVDINSQDFSLVSRALSTPLLDVAYPGAMERLKELNYDPAKMSFVQFTVADGKGGDEEYVVAMDPVSNKVLIPWEIDKDGWGTPDQLEPPEGNRYEWSEADVKLAEDGGFEISALSGRYFVVGRTGGDNGKWSVGLPLRDVSTGENVVIDQVRGGGGMLFAPAEFLKGNGGIKEESIDGEVWTDPREGIEDNNSSLPGTTTESLPADVAEILKDYPGYTVVDDDMNGTNDRIVITKGDTLFKFVPEADRINGKEWQRIETLNLTDGTKLEMPRFETFVEALKYIDYHANWRSGEREKILDAWTITGDGFSEAAAYSRWIRMIPSLGGGVAFTGPEGGSKFVLVSVRNTGSDSLIIFESDEGQYAPIFVPGDVDSQEMIKRGFWKDVEAYLTPE